MRNPMRRTLSCVRRSDAAPRRAEAVVAARFLLELVEQRVVAHDHVGALADDQVLGLDTAFAQLTSSAKEHDRVDDDAVADDAGAVAGRGCPRHELELDLAVLGDDRVAGVVARPASG